MSKRTKFEEITSIAEPIAAGTAALGFVVDNAPAVAGAFLLLQSRIAEVETETRAYLRACQQVEAVLVEAQRGEGIRTRTCRERRRG